MYSNLSGIIISFGIICCGRAFAIPFSGDNDIEKYVDAKMSNYSTWIVNNKLDPSAPNPVGHSFSNNAHRFDKVLLLCTFENLTIAGHSNAYRDARTKTECNRTEHAFRVKISVTKPYSLYGDFRCSGMLNASYSDELENNIGFYGKGRFILVLSNVSESLTFENIKVTDNYKLDLDRGQTHGSYYAGIDDIHIIAEWNNPIVNAAYSSYILEVFRNSHYWFFKRDASFYPSLNLLELYLLEVAKSLDLIDAAPGGDGTKLEQSGITLTVGLLVLHLFY